MTQGIDITSWVPNLLGPVVFQINGVAQSVPKRLTINLIGGASTCVDNAANNSTDLHLVGDSNATSIQSIPVDTATPSDQQVMYYDLASGKLKFKTESPYTPPTGSGFPRIISGVQQAAASAVNLASADVTGLLPLADQAAPTGSGIPLVTSGAWNGATTTSLPIANGGTALTGAGSNGNVITSNGTAFSMAFIADANVSSAAAIQGTKISPNFGNQSLTWGTNAATTGTMRWASSNTAYIRNNANSADLVWFSKDTSDNVTFGGDASIPQVYLGGTSTTESFLQSSNVAGMLSGGQYFELFASGYISWSNGSNPGAQAGASNLWSNNGRPACTDSSANVGTMMVVSQSLNSDYTTTGATTASVTNFQVSVAANETVEIELTGVISCSSTGGCKIAVVGPSGMSFEGYVDGNGGALGTNANAIITAGNTLTSAFNTFAGSTPIYMWVSCKNGSTPGTVTIPFCSTTAGQTTTMKAGARIHATWPKGV